MKIVFLKSRAAFRGGLEKYTSKLSQAFAQKGHTVTLLTTGPSPQIEGVQAISLTENHPLSFYHLQRFDLLCQKWLENHPAPIIFGMERTTGQTHYRAGSGVHAVFLERRKWIDPFWKRWTFPVNPLHRTILALEKKAFESSTLKKLFTNSKMVHDEILQKFEIAAEKIEVVHNGVEWRGWKEEFEKTFTRSHSQTHQFLFIGNGYQRKGLTFLLKALAKLRHENFCLTAIGKEKNLSHFIQMSEHLGIQKKVRFLGPQKTILPFYQAADTLIIPSIYDPFANVTLEGLAMGLFVISSPYNGGKEILQPTTGSVIEDLFSEESFKKSLDIALQRPKTENSARAIRDSVKELDFSIQLDKIVTRTLQSF